MSRAAYMRDYRAKKKASGTSEPINMGPSWSPSGDLFKALAEVDRLEAEVRHLKEELAKRPTMNIEHGTITVPDAPRKGDRITIIADPGFNTRPFTPVPRKKS